MTVLSGDVVQAAPGTVGDRNEASNQSERCARSKASSSGCHVPEEMEVEVELRVSQTPQPQSERLCEAVCAQGKRQVEEEKESL